MSRVLAGLFCAGATLALLTVLLPHPRRANVPGLLVVVAVAYTVAGALSWRSQSLSVGRLRIALAWGSTLITLVAYFSGARPSPLVFFYLWVFLYAAYFFSRREAAQQIAYVGCALAALLILAPPSSGAPAWWLVAMGSLLVAAVIVALMRHRSEQLIARLYEAARTDSLTGLLNRGGFRERLELELERARRGLAPMTLVIGDLDHFKDVNDRQGHPAGDDVLRRVGRLIGHGVRQIDAVARVGGEEFALVLPGVDAAGALTLAERLRVALREEFSADRVPVTISFGVAAYPAHAETAGSLLRAGDEALYAAKQAGRDRTVTHAPIDAGCGAADVTRRDVEAERFLRVLIDLAETTDLRFSGSARHSETVGRYAEMIAEQLGLGAARVARVRMAGLLHDVGKVAIPDAVLQKPGSLSDEEFALIKQHPVLGARMMEHPELSDIRDWVATHHERPDGRGYPDGLRHDAISLEAQILAVADAYEAMTSDRAYRRSIGTAVARDELQRGAGSQFEPLVVDAFLAILEREPRRFRAAAERDAGEDYRSAGGLTSSTNRSTPRSDASAPAAL